MKQRKYLDARERFYDEVDPQRRGPTLDWVWDGDGTNPNALLTVFRNFDNATVRARASSARSRRPPG